MISSFEKAKVNLALSSEPDTLPCREKEVTQIYNILYNVISSNSGLNMYISGGTGTGKTSTIKHVLSQLKKTVPSLHIIFINAMKLGSPSDAFREVWNSLKEYRATTPGMKKLPKVTKVSDIPLRLSKYFAGTTQKSAKDGPYVIIVIDELDFLVTKGQREIYEFFNWPQGSKCKLAVIGIANTVNLPEQLVAKISSRIETTQRIIFHTYTFDQIQKIILDRVGKLNVFDEDAILLCAKKVANSSGDIRRGLDICRRAIELVEESQRKEYFRSRPRKRKQSTETAPASPKKVKESSGSPKKVKDDNKTVRTRITIADIHRAFEDITNSTSYPLEELTDYEKLILLSIIKLLKITPDTNELKLENVLNLVQVDCKKINIPVLTMHELQDSVDRLVAMDIIQLKETNTDIFPRVLLNTQVDVIKEGLQNTIKRVDA